MSLLLFWWNNEIKCNDSAHAYMPVTGEILVPNGDLVTGNWINELNGSTLYPSIADIDSNTYDWVDDGVVNDTFTVSLSNPTGAVPAGKHVIHIVTENIDATSTPTIKIELYQGVTKIAERSLELVYNNGEVETFLELTSGEIAQITNYDELKYTVTIEAVS